MRRNIVEHAQLSLLYLYYMRERHRSEGHGDHGTKVTDQVKRCDGLWSGYQLSVGR